MHDDVYRNITHSKISWKEKKIFIMKQSDKYIVEFISEKNYS